MKKVLIVDDAMFMRVALKTMLEKNGYEVVGEAENGADAISKYSILKPDIVTMDITMPKMDGVEALTEIKKQDPNCKIVMISALGQESWVKKAIIIGAKGFIVKPFKEEHVIKTLSKL
ncbi:histidine kinase [Clostridium carboxidivorans P7]|uniref:Stage 0 sporulation protein A homolog n=1 Tax=Clostridium carboxidivorans P7 TaxID=536227 RepID=C6PN39_9CLOT|nr:response regulator [Clostridium carboxidivorans]AKN30857.1 histidine kinase [Clostridium carboxidivorans P7]EET89372.1 response regulator receiver protein [Clostridium carboxidivorans P7]EFG88895.1 chemotaxis protein CheY [Clostridium carboxidivorans P7]